MTDFFSDFAKAVAQMRHVLRQHGFDEKQLSITIPAQAYREIGQSIRISVPYDARQGWPSQVYGVPISPSRKEQHGD